MQMFVPVSTCASNGDAFFFRRDRREILPLGCSLLDICEVAEETGISVDDVISRLDDFDSADALLGFGVLPGERILRAESEFSSRVAGAPYFAEPTVSQGEFVYVEPEAAAAPRFDAEPIVEALRTEETPSAGTVESFVEAKIEPVWEEIRVEEKSIVRAAPEKTPVKRPMAGAISKLLRRNLEELRKWSTVRVEAAEPREEAEDEHLINLDVPEDYVVETTTESTVWPWEVRDGLTLKEALEAIDDRALTSLTEEVVNCTISGQLGEGGVKSLCETFGKAKEQIYSEIQRESRRRITRMNRKPRAAVGTASDATMEMAMRMAKQFLQSEMGKDKATRFESTVPSDDGNYYIFQKHRVEDEDSVDFPNERVYYRETGDGWAISVGY